MPSIRGAQAAIRCARDLTRKNLTSLQAGRKPRPRVLYRAFRGEGQKIPTEYACRVVAATAVFTVIAASRSHDHPGPCSAPAPSAAPMPARAGPANTIGRLVRSACKQALDVLEEQRRRDVCDINRCARQWNKVAAVLIASAVPRLCERLCRRIVQLAADDEKCHHKLRGDVPQCTRTPEAPRREWAPRS